jgi:transketolase
VPLPTLDPLATLDPAPILEHVRHDPADPLWPDRDRVLLSAHAPPLRQGGGIGTEVPGPPGLAFGAATGAALAERLLAARFGRSLVDHRVWLMADARELDSGIAAEAAAAAGALALGRLIVLATLPETEAPALARFTALGWTLRRVPAASAEDLEAAVSAALRAQKPTLIAILTNAAEPESPIATLAPSPLATGTRRSWLKRLHRHAAAAAFQEAIRGAVLPRLPASADPASLQAVPAEALQALFNRAATLMPDLAMLPPPSEAAPDPVWSNRPHAAGAALLGMALHGGLLPVGRFPAAAADAIRPAERAAAALGLRQIHILAGCDPVLAGSLHDAGADIANLATYYPADAAEAIECAGLALRRHGGPSLLILAANQAQAPDHRPAPGCARGGYRLTSPEAADVTLLASGPDVGIALAVSTALAPGGIQAAIASIPCWSTFLAQDPAYRRSILDPGLGAGRRIALVSNAFARATLVLREGDLALDTASGDAAALAARITRHLARNPAILEDSDNLLETARDID